MQGWKGLEVVLVSGAAFNKVRTYVIVAVFLLMGIQYFRQRRAHIKAHREAEEKMDHLEGHYQKDQEGYYPWEKDTDDSPSRIPPDSKRINNTWSKKRGRW